MSGIAMVSRGGALILLAVACLHLAACQPDVPTESPIDNGPVPYCSAAWMKSVEERVPTGDGAGHGPDIGSDEWKSVVEFKLGIRDNIATPDPSTEAWCQYIDELITRAD